MSINFLYLVYLVDAILFVVHKKYNSCSISCLVATFFRRFIHSSSFVIVPHREIITSSAESKDGPEGGGLTVSAERQLKQMVSGIYHMQSPAFSENHSN
jgi:hypothetical protein